MTASVAGYIDQLPDGADISTKVLAGELPPGQAAIGTVLRELSVVGHLRRVKEHVNGNRWVTRTHFSRAARSDAWWAAHLAGRVMDSWREPELEPESLLEREREREREWGPEWGPESDSVGWPESDPVGWPEPEEPAPVARPRPRPAVEPAPVVRPRPAVEAPARAAAPVPATTTWPTRPVRTAPARAADPVPAGPTRLTRPVRTRPPARTVERPAQTPAYALLARLGLADPRMTLSAADCAALEPVVEQWFERGAGEAQVLQALVAGLPTRVHFPRRIAEVRLAALPPYAGPLPEPEPAQAPPRMRFMECTTCRAPGRPEALPGGLCEACRPVPLPAAARSESFDPKPVHRHAAAVRAAIAPRRAAGAGAGGGTGGAVGSGGVKPAGVAAQRESPCPES
ncbi:hypothetical protein [Streptomyces sp. H27-D2]|uniref:hypothetical protein n=1 Tax=Streptomyces sp. H27-D2 TaxID=3046304 RepID=UPI002DB562FB|nr:hypothetical protein [Streptomyces sp. H27-D2]MEC4018372.1 hypothetical protein [Streptomyces sp. H27-D2]